MNTMQTIFKDSHGFGEVWRDGNGIYGSAGNGHMLCIEMAKEIEKLRVAINNIRDSVLNERAQLAESGLTNDQVNAVLGIIDDETNGIQL